MRISNRAWAIVQALRKTNPKAAQEYYDWAPRREDIERQAVYAEIHLAEVDQKELTK